MSMADTDTLQAVARWLDDDGRDPDTFDSPWYRLEWRDDEFVLEEK